MKKFNILNKGIIGVTTVACVLLAAGIAYGNNYVSNSNANSAKQGAANAVEGTNTAKKITADEAKNIALAHAKLAQKDVNFVKAELKTDNNRLIYDVDFYSGNVEYDYDIDAVTGEIISSDLDIENYNIPAQTTVEQQKTAAPAADIGVERAKEIALAHAGLSNDKVSFVKAQLDNEDGVKVYDIEFYSGNVEYDYEISVADGTIISADQDIENYSIPAPASTAAPESTAAPTVAQTSGISAEKAKQIALSHAGVGAATFTKVELDTDDGIKVYEIEFKVGNVEYEYDINASNGAIIKSSSEIDD